MSATPVAAPGSSGVLGGASTTEVTYYGYSLHETGSSTAQVKIRDGGSASGRILDTINFTSGSVAAKDWPFGVNARNGLYFELVSGAVEGVVLIG